MYNIRNRLNKAMERLISNERYFGKPITIFRSNKDDVSGAVRIDKFNLVGWTDGADVQVAEDSEKGGDAVLRNLQAMIPVSKMPKVLLEDLVKPESDSIEWKVECAMNPASDERSYYIVKPSDKAHQTDYAIGFVKLRLLV